jgi:hypothetical protein
MKLKWLMCVPVKHKSCAENETQHWAPQLVRRYTRLLTFTIFTMQAYSTFHCFVKHFSTCNELQKMFDNYVYVTICCVLKHHFIKNLIAIQSQALTGPEGSRRLRVPDFKAIGT